MSAADAWSALIPLAVTAGLSGAAGWFAGKARGYADALADVRREIQRRTGIEP